LIIDNIENKLFVLSLIDTGFMDDMDTFKSAHQHLNQILNINLSTTEFKRTKLYSYYKSDLITSDIWMGFMILILNTFNISLDDLIAQLTPKTIQSSRGFRSNIQRDPNSFGSKGVQLYANAISEVFGNNYPRIAIPNFNIED
jgi:hypothetical protein